MMTNEKRKFKHALLKTRKTKDHINGNVGKVNFALQPKRSFKSKCIECIVHTSNLQDLLKDLVIFVNGKRHTVTASEVTPETTLNTYLRNTLQLKGTKFMCLEGGCGACIVSINRCNPVTGKLETFAVNSCLVSIFSCFGWDIWTIEGLGNSTSSTPHTEHPEKIQWHPVRVLHPWHDNEHVWPQKSLGEVTMKQVENSFGGNICRCTGYRSILSAFKCLCVDATTNLTGRYPDIEDVGKQCDNMCAIKLSMPFYFKLGTKSWIKVMEFDDLVQIVKSFHGSGSSYMLIAGNTGKGVYKMENDLDVYVDIVNVKELVRCDVNKNHVSLGAGAGTLGGNLMMKNKWKNFPSDVFLFLETVGAQVIVVDINNLEHTMTLLEFLQVDMTDKILKKIVMPALDESHFYNSYKIMPRAQNAHALVNAGFLLKMDVKYTVKSVRIVYGCINQSLHMQILSEELVPDFELPDPKPQFRKNLAIALLYKYILSITPTKHISKNHVSGGNILHRPVSIGTQDFDTNKALYPLSQPIPKIEAVYQTTGEAEYITDMPDLPNQLFAAFVLAKATPSSKILKIKKEKSDGIVKRALALGGVVAFFDKYDIPGKNTFTPKDVFLSVEEELFYHSQPVGIIVATSHETAEKAADLGKKKPVLTIRDILERGITDKLTHDRIVEPKRQGKNVKYTVKGTFDVSWQYHFHMETQCCNVVPKEDGLDMYPSSQWMDLSQNAAAAVLNIPANKINVVVRRLGGAFGAKIIRNSLVSSATALAAYKLKKPVKMWLPLETNMRVIGKRHPLFGNYEAGVDEHGVIQGLENTFYYDHGCSENEQVTDLLFDTYFGTYESDTWYTNSNLAHTDMHPSCFMRAPGSVEGLAMCEAIMEHIAMSINMDPLEFRIINMSKKRGVLLKHVREFKKWANVEERESLEEKGLSVVPMVFPLAIIFNYGVIISIYHSDGSVALSHGGVEIGQGINTKALQVCAYKLGIPMEKISVKPSNNLVAANSSMTGASFTSEGVCWGVIKACDILLERLKPIRATMENPTWEELIQKCHDESVHLTATSMASPKDPELKLYDIYGVCASEIELDVLTGQHQVLRVDLLEDVGDSMSPEIDIGQVEGAFIMGQGYFTSEQIVTGEEGEVLTNRTWNYKPPGAKDIPINFHVKFPRNNPNPVGVLKSKAVGEPPFCLSVSIPLAIRQAVASVREEVDKNASKWYPFDGPSTVENTFMNCQHDYRHYTL
ncbi:hypothetical protein NQ318_003457 [Aromia moschata]|uniref:2Fe-2S ferredoxin-type domain-containing protein n=1 Tax=Aromia moschata TaxID=1265417 RepID=A0AAV8YUA5_9CUCU|nr:hypothetical protein NQ318_003457 [Aromia moschata]